MSDLIEVEGLKELRSGLKAMDPKLPRQIGKANKKAGELIAAEARGRAKALGGSAAKGADSLKSSARQTAVTVSLGGPSAPWMLGAEYGSIAYAQFDDWKGNQWSPDSGDVGYFLHPTIRDKKEEFVEVYADLLEKLLDELPNPQI